MEPRGPPKELFPLGLGRGQGVFLRPRSLHHGKTSRNALHVGGTLSRLRLEGAFAQLLVFLFLLAPAPLNVLLLLLQHVPLKKPAGIGLKLQRRSSLPGLRCGQMRLKRQVLQFLLFCAQSEDAVVGFFLVQVASTHLIHRSRPHFLRSFGQLWLERALGVHCLGGQL